MGDADSGPIHEADPASVSGFRLDKYLVTVGRFRQFVNTWNGGAGYTPAAGSGKHTHLNAGLGLANIASPGTYETGWVASDNSHIAPTDANLACVDAMTSLFSPTWTSSAGSEENLPINCVNWWESYAFCIWDGGFLPSEAEWEYAAAGGSQQRPFPWGSAGTVSQDQVPLQDQVPGLGLAPQTATEYAICDCDYPSGSQYCSEMGNIAPVGTATLGAGLWGQLDMVGEVREWNIDYWMSPYVDPCTNCADLTAGSYRVKRGGDFYTTGPVGPQSRDAASPSDRQDFTGFRCARTP